MITVAQLILASASLPLIGYGGFIIKGGDKIDGAYTILGGLYTLFAVFFIPSGFPGALVFPGAMGIAAIGGFHSYGKSKKRGKLIKGITLLAISIILILFQVVL